MAQAHNSFSLANPHPTGMDTIQKIAAAVGGLGLLVLFIALCGQINGDYATWLAVSLTLMAAGVCVYAWREYEGKPEGIKNNHVWHRALTNRGLWAWVVGVVLTGFYLVLYFRAEYLGLGESGAANTGLIALFDPLSQFLKNEPASQWFVYGVLYTLAILIFGVKFLLKYRHNRYQQFRTLSVMFFQLGFAFLIPEILMRLNYPYNNFTNMWPLNYYFFDGWSIEAMTTSGKVGMFMLVWGILMIFVISPVLTYFYGKRWYCSWVCGCGGLAETAGDPFRHLSDKSLNAWKLERWMIHGVLVFAIVMTLMVLIFNNGTLRSWYGVAIGSMFSGVIGVGFYPIFGSRVWCRFGCPMAAILGLQQRFFSRFRITTNGGQCISCGNCSTYCEMGIDVRSYAQKGQNIVRASCVGCGICAAVCPRGVLRLENSAIDINARTDEMKVIMISEDGVRI